MIIIKKKYYFYIDSIKTFNLNLIKNRNKIVFIYRNNTKSRSDSLNEIINYRKLCKKKKIKFFVANDFVLFKKCKADGLYLSSYNKKIYLKIYSIGSAHNYREIQQKFKQGCKAVILSRLFKVNYDNNKQFYGVIKFNLINQKYKLDLIPLGGISNMNLLRLNLVNSKSFGILSALKKKPVIANRLF